MLIAPAGYLPPVLGAIMQKFIDVAVVGKALRVPLPLHGLSDY
jgi:hypothetical protein